MLLGAWNGMLVAAAGVQPIIATLGLMVAGRGMAQLVTDGQILVYEHRLIYVFSGFCAGVAGLIFASEIKGADANTAGLNAELDAILAVVIGGTSMEGGRFTLLGSVLGALMIQSLNTTILTRGVPGQATLVLKAVVVFAICLLQSDAFRRLTAVLLRRTRPP